MIDQIMILDEPTDSRTFLVHLAAESLAPILAGCAANLAARAKADTRSVVLDRGPGRAINCFGPPIIERWLADLKDRSRDQQADAITHLASLTAAESRRAAQAAVERVAAAASPEDKNMAVEYLSAIPLAVRRSLVADPASGRMVVPNYLWSQPDQRLLRLLPTDVPPLPLGSDVPATSYRLEELLGIGGFGAVYKATNRFEQNQPPRAIKFCLDTSMVATLHRERAILDRLMAVAGATWSNRIVRLYGYALDVELPFLVYEFVAGGDLTHHLLAAQQQTGRGFEPARVLGIVRQVAEALAFAHGQGLVHRDLKPANVLVSGSTIKLTDFGIGGVLASQALRGTSVGSAALGHLSAADQIRLFCGSGTPLYMSPEQRRGDQPDPRHDLYSLGVMWYQLLVGDVTRELHPGWPDELIEEFQVPRAHIQLIQRCVGYFKKRPAHAGELLALFTGAPPRPPASSAGAMAPAEPRRPPGPDVAPADSDDGEFERLELVLVQQIDQDAFDDARLTAAAMLELRPGDGSTLEAIAFIDKRLRVALGEILVFKDHQGWVRSVAFSPDGRQALSGGDDAFVRLWNLDQGRAVRSLAGHEGAVMAVAFAPSGRLAVSGGWDGTIRCWDVAGGRELRRLQGDWNTLKCLAVAPGGRQLLAGCDDHCMHLLEIETGRELLAFAGHTDLVQSLAFTPDGRHAVSGSDDGTIRLWEVASGRELGCLSGHQDPVTAVACSPDGRRLLSASSDGTARLWDLDAGQELRCLVGHTSWVNSVVFSADGSRALTGSGGEIADGAFTDGDDRTVRLWDLATGREIARFEGHTASVTSVALAPGGNLALSGSLDSTVRVLGIPV